MSVPSCSSSFLVLYNLGFYFSLLEVLCELTLCLTVAHRCIVEVLRFKVCVQVELDAGVTDLHEKMCFTPPLKSKHTDINISIFRSLSYQVFFLLKGIECLEMAANVIILTSKAFKAALCRSFYNG